MPDEEALVEGPVARTLLSLAAPLVAQNVVRVIQQVVDAFWVGRVGEAAVGAVGLVLPVLAAAFALLVAPFVGTQVLVSRRVGADDPGGARAAVGAGVVLSVVIGAVVAAALGIGAPRIVALLGAGPDVGPLAAAYLAVVGAGLPLAGASDAVEAGYTGWGATRLSLAVNVATVGVNLALDPVLVLGLGPAPPLGVRGAAYATVAGYAAGLGLALALLSRRRVLALAPASLAPSRADLRRLLAVGAPVTGRRLLSAAVRVVLVGVVAAVAGAPGLAAYTVGARVASVAFVPAQGLSQAAQSMIGQNLGAARPDRADRTALVGVGLAAGLLAAVGAVQWLVPGPLATAFVPDLSAAGRAHARAYLRILAYGYPAIGAADLVVAGFNAATRTRVGLVADLLKYWGVRLPVASLALPAVGPPVGVGAVFWAVTASNVAAAAGLAAYFARERRRGLFAGDPASGSGTESGSGSEAGD
ncbi:MAG: MATE family efflux transporter [Haloferacaceae archaeon]